MINRLFLLLLLLGSSSALKGLRRRAQDSPPTTPVIVQSDGLPKAPKEEDTTVTGDGLPKAPKVEDATVTGDSMAEEKEEKDKELKEEKEVKDKEEKEKKDKEKKEKNCRKRKKEDPTPPDSPERFLQELITNQDGLAKKSESESAVGKKEDAEPPAPVSPPETQPDVVVDSTTEPTTDVVEPANEATADVTEDTDLPFCPDVGKKARSKAECDALLLGLPKGKSIKGQVKFEVIYDSGDDAQIMDNVQDKIKKKSARKAAGCNDERRSRFLEFLNKEEEVDASTLYISGVSFGEFAVSDKCSSGMADGCDNVAAPLEIYYESADNRDATNGEGEVMMEDVIKTIQAEEFEGAQLDNFVGEIHTNDKNRKGIIVGAAVAGAALVAGAVIYKRYGSNLMAKWA